jgi:hypothetical protein
VLLTQPKDFPFTTCAPTVVGDPAVACVVALVGVHAVADVSTFVGFPAVAVVPAVDSIGDTVSAVDTVKTPFFFSKNVDHTQGNFSLVSMTMVQCVKNKIS